jgi:hypothetical protein
MQSLSCSKSEKKVKRVYRVANIFCEKKTKCPANHSTEVRGVENDSHGETTNGTGDGDGHDPGEGEETNSLPVNSFDGSVAETDTDGGTGNTHGGRHGEGVLREDQDGESGTHLHRTTWDELVCEIVRWRVNKTYLC